MLDALNNLRQAHNFLAEPVTDTQIEELVHAAAVAPSSNELHPCHFVVVRERELLDKLAKATPWAAPLKTAPTAILICVSDQETQEWVEDAAMAAALLAAQASSMGLSASIVQFRGHENREGSAEEYVRQLVAVPDSMRIFCAIGIGKPADEGKASLPLSQERVHHEKW